MRHQTPAAVWIGLFCKFDMIGMVFVHRSHPEAMPVRYLRLALLGFCALPLSATAAQITQISYRITGDVFLGPVATADSPITGGSLVYTPPAPVSTPGVPSPIGVQVTGGSLFLSLFGPGGSLSYFWPSVHRARFTALAFYVEVGYPTPPPGVGHYGGYPIEDAGMAFSAYNGSGSGQVGGRVHITPAQTITWAFNFGAGSEVRTLVPEASPSALLGVGLVLLGFAARRTSRRLWPPGAPAPAGPGPRR